MAVKKYLIILSVLLLVLPMISAIEIDMKDNFSNGETLMARISGNFIEPILKENIFLYRAHVRVPFEPQVAKINDDYYIYAPLLGKDANNYSLKIENAKYMKGAEISEDEIIKNFTISEDTAYFTINPGFIISDEDFSIEVQNLQDFSISVQVKTTILDEEETTKGFFDILLGTAEEEEEEQETSTSLKSGEIKKINFNIESIKKTTLKTIELSSGNFTYEIPAYISVVESDKPEIGFEFEPLSFDISMPTNSESTRVLYLYNTGQELIDNISISISDELKPYVTISENYTEDLRENDSLRIELTITSGSKEGSFEGQITGNSGELNEYVGIFLNFIEDYISPENKSALSQTCEELEGKICERNQECVGESVDAKDSICCLGNCQEKEKSSTGKIIGWLIIIAVIGYLVWFFEKRYKGVTRTVDILRNVRK